MVFEGWDDDDNEMLVSLDGARYPADETPPPGPIGDDPKAFAPLGVGDVDLAGLHAALRGEVGDPSVLLAEEQHAAIVRALNLDPCPLTVAFRHVAASDFPGALRVGLSSPTRK